MGRPQEFQRAGGVDAPHDRFGFGRVIRAGTVADVVIRQIGVGAGGAGGAGDAGLLRGGVPTGRGDYGIGGRVGFGRRSGERVDQRVGGVEQATHRRAIVAQGDVRLILNGVAALSFERCLLLGALARWYRPSSEPPDR